MHYGTFPLLTETPDKLRAELGRDSGVNVIELASGEPYRW